MKTPRCHRLFSKIALLLFAVTTGSVARFPSCTDVSKVDFAAITINVPDEGPVKLEEGRGYTPRIAIDGKDLGPEWEVTIEDDILLSPEPGVTLRLIGLNADHLLGSGAWGYALMYACKKGRLHRVFQSIGHLYGVVLKKINEKTFTIGYAVYLQGDGNCCPSMRATDTYEWYGSDGTFKRTKSRKEPMKKE